MNLSNQLYFIMSQSNGSHTGTSSHESGNETSAILAASGVYEVQAERGNVVAVEGLLYLGHGENTADTVAPSMDLHDALPRKLPPKIGVTAAPSPETRRMIESEASWLRDIGRSRAGPTGNCLTNVLTSMLDVYDGAWVV